MMELFQVAAKLVLDKSGYDKDVTDADKQGKSLAENLTGYMEKAKKVLTGIMSAVVVQKVASAVWNLAKETSAAGDRIDKTSQALGLSRKAFQEWDYILSQSGASIDSMGMSMKTMNEAISKNSGETAVALSKLGLSAAQLQNLSPEQQFEELVKAFQKMPPSAKKSEYALLLFGRNAQSLMPLLNSASGSVDELRNRAHELGLIMSDEDVDASVAFGDALDDLNRVWTAVKQKFGAQMLPTFTRGMIAVANSLGKVANQVQTAFKTGDWSGVFETITNEIKTLLPKAIDTIVNIGVGLFQNADKIIDLGFSVLQGLIAGLTENMPTFVAKIPDIFNSMVEGIKALGTAAGNGIIDLINLAFGTNIPHLEEITWPTWDDVEQAATTAWNLIKEGLKTVFKFVFGETEDGGIKWPTWPEVQAAAETAWTAIKNGLATLTTTVGKWVFGERDDGAVDWPTWDDVGELAKTAWEGIKTGLSNLVTSVGKFIFGERDDGSVDWPTWDEVGTFAEQAWQGIKDGLDGLATSIGKFIFGERDDGSVAWPTWDEVMTAATEAWQGIKTGLETLVTTVGKFIFGERDDGSVDWPTWPEIQQAAIDAWQGIKDGLAGLATSVGKFIFGERDDGSIKWPTWAEVGQAARDAVSGIITGLGNLVTELGKFFFGERDDSATQWITWDDVKAAAETAWQGIIDGLSGFGTMLGAFVFGTRDDGAVDWPTWDDVKAAAETAWTGIRDGLNGLVTSIGKFIFGARDDGSVAWPTWDDVKTAAETAWNGIVQGLAESGIGKLIISFGVKLNSWFTRIKDWLNGKGLSEITLDFGATVSEWISRVWDWVTNGIKQLTINFTGEIFGWVKTIADWVTNGVNVGVNFLGDLFGGNDPEPSTYTVNGQTYSDPMGVFTHNGGVNSFDGGLYAKGLNYVPSEGLYRLHRGETILNQSQGRAWRNNESNGFNVDEMYYAVASAVSEAVSNIQINMSGKKVGNAVTRQVSRNQYQDALGRRYAPI